MFTYCLVALTKIFYNGTNFTIFCCLQCGEAGVSFWGMEGDGGGWRGMGERSKAKVHAGLA